MSLPNNFTKDEEIDVIVNINFNIQSYLISGGRIESIKMRDHSHSVDTITGTKATTQVKDLEMRITTPGAL